MEIILCKIKDTGNWKQRRLYFERISKLERKIREFFC